MPAAMWRLLVPICELPSELVRTAVPISATSLGGPGRGWGRVTRCLLENISLFGFVYWLAHKTGWFSGDLACKRRGIVPRGRSLDGRDFGEGREGGIGTGGMPG